MNKPIRVQRKRTKGYKMPPNVVYVGRPTKWGNPYSIKDGWTLEESLNMYRHWLYGLMEHDAKKQLKGKDLACWCSLDKPCHADILLEIANQ